MKVTQQKEGLESSKFWRIGFKPAPEEPPKRFQNVKTKIKAYLQKQESANTGINPIVWPLTVNYPNSGGDQAATRTSGGGQLVTMQVVTNCRRTKQKLGVAQLAVNKRSGEPVLLETKKKKDWNR